MRLTRNELKRLNAIFESRDDAEKEDAQIGTWLRSRLRDTSPHTRRHITYEPHPEGHWTVTMGISTFSDMSPDDVGKLTQKVAEKMGLDVTKVLYRGSHRDSDLNVEVLTFTKYQKESRKEKKKAEMTDKLAGVDMPDEARALLASMGIINE